jgi:hypothetical protein
MPRVSPTFSEVEHSFATDAALKATLAASRDPNVAAGTRISDAVMALAIASNAGSSEALVSAYQAVEAVRHAADVNPFDTCRADLIYFASIGDRAAALKSAEKLTAACRETSDLNLACKGLRNAAEVFATFGKTDRAYAVLHEARSDAVRLGYIKQIAWSDIRLADLALQAMDVQSSEAYLCSAVQAIGSGGLATPLLHLDLNLQRFWTSLVSGDLTQAHRSAKVVAKRLHRMHTTPGTGLFTTLSVRLALHGGSFTKETARDFDVVYASIGSRPFYPNENFSLAALVLTAKNAKRTRDVQNVVNVALKRFKDNGRRPWPFLLAQLKTLSI